MSWRFQKRVSLGPLVRLNLSKSGVSMSLGPRGFHLTFGRGGIRWSASLPGTGLSVNDRLDKPRRRRG